MIKGDQPMNGSVHESVPLGREDEIVRNPNLRRSRRVSLGSDTSGIAITKGLIHSLVWYGAARRPNLLVKEGPSVVYNRYPDPCKFHHNDAER
jgi:hypothetical protein